MLVSWKYLKNFLIRDSDCMKKGKDTCVQYCKKTSSFCQTKSSLYKVLFQEQLM
jgi:hypothetical protein